MFSKRLIGAFIASSLLPCCGNTCKQDTDCVLPEVCISSICINPYFPDGKPDLAGDFEESTDWNDDKANPDGQDIPDGWETDGTGPCSPQMSPKFQILGLNVESPADEHPEVVTLADNSFYILGRKYDATEEDYPYKLTLVQISTSGRSTGYSVDIIAAAVLPGYHQLLAIGNEMGVLFEAHPDTGTDRLVYIHVIPGAVPPADIQPISVTDADSSEPYGADNGGNLFVVYKEAPAAAGSTIESCFVEHDGLTSTAGLRLGGDGTTSVGEPVVSYGRESYLLAYFYHGNPADSDVDRLVLVEVDADGAPIETAGQEVDLESADNKVVGRPAIAWTGDRWAVLWQEALGPDGSSSYLHMTTMVPGGAFMDVNITAQWSSAITLFSKNQPGELDMVWNGSSLGIAIKHDGGTSRKVFFGEFEISGTIIGGAFAVSDQTTTFAPSVTFMQTATERYYLFTWLSSSTGPYYIYDSTYGCNIP
jgi:hypothetical protein